MGVGPIFRHQYRRRHRHSLDVMAERDVQLVPGQRYYAGVELPWYVPRSVVTSAAQDVGFEDIVWHAGDQKPPIEPRTDPSYQADSSEWATGVYRGAPQVYHFAHAPSWIVSATPAVAATPPARPSDAVIGESLRLLRIVNGALESGDPNLMRQASAYFSEHGMPKLAATLAGSAEHVSKGRYERVATWAAAIGATVGLVSLMVAAIRYSRKH